MFPEVKEAIQTQTSSKQKPNVTDENVFKIGNVSFYKIIDDYKKFESKHHKEM